MPFPLQSCRTFNSGALVSKVANLDERMRTSCEFHALPKSLRVSFTLISMTFFFFSILHSCILDATQQHHVSYIGLVLLVTLGHAPLMGCERAHSRSRLKLTIQLASVISRCNLNHCRFDVECRCHRLQVSRSAIDDTFSLRQSDNHMSQK